jgi:branched-chain amino acid transport system permease protein
MFYETPVKTIAIVVLFAGMVVYALTTGFYGRELIAEAAALIILAVSLDMVAGYGGMISLCHGAMYGIGAYIFAVLTAQHGVSAAIAVFPAMAGGALFGLIVGTVTSRTRGIFFIMATLAFGEMVHAYVFENRAIGGDDGLSGVLRIDLTPIGLDLDNSLHFALFSIVLAALAYVLVATILRSGFGRTLVGIRSNEARMRALGLPVSRYKATAFALSGGLAALSGTIAAQQTMFVSPEIVSWLTSGEALVVVILGGLGTLVGPALGAVFFIFLEHEISLFTRYSNMIIGIVLILVVVLGNRGLYGQFEYIVERWRRRGSDLPLSPTKEKEVHNA